MADQQLSAVLRRLRSAAGTPHTGRTDRELIADFAASDDQAAFVALVKRHGPLVMGICRRVLHHRQDAEDAFQATFLLLARRGAGIRKPESLASWLHGVAYRMARNAKRSASRRRKHEGTVQPAPSVDRTAGLEWREVQAILDDEISRLPEVYRTPFILFYLEHRKQADIARQLGIKAGTVWSRLAHARRLLQERLSRRGVALPAVLGLLAVSAEATSADVSASLVSSVVRAAAISAAGGAGADVASPGVMTLLQGADQAMTFGKCKTATLFLLAAGILGTGFAFAWGRPPAARVAAKVGAETPPAQPVSGPGAAGPGAPDKKESETKDVVDVSGRVLGPDGKPLAGARLFLAPWGIKKEDLKVLATTGDDGRFRAPVSAAAVRTGAKLVAVAKDHGPDWLWLGQKTTANEFTLRLVKDDVPVTGRVLDLEGRPVAGASVGVLFVEAVDLKPWLADPRHGDLAPTGKRYLPTDLDGPASVKTDKDGRFRLTGFGRDRVAHLQIRGAGVEDNDVEVITRAGKVDGLRLESRAVYPLDSEFTARPGKPIVGTVRDRKTGKPIAEIEVVFPNTTWTWARATTDEKGHYKIDGVGKQKEYGSITAGGLPYFTATKTQVADTPGFDPIVLDFELDRGIVMKGRLTDAVTGQPVPGNVRYEPAGDNPNLKDFTGDFTGLPRSSGHTGEDGSFTVLAVPGAGQLAAVAHDSDAYALAKEDGFRQSNAVVRVNVSEKDEKSQVCDIALRPARSLGGSVTGPDGKPVGGAHVAGLHAVRPFLRGAEKLSDESFRVHGLTPKDERVLVFVHPEKKLAKVQKVAAEDGEPLTVRLEPTGALAGRVLDSAGRPWAGVKVKAAYSIVALQEARMAGKDEKDLPWVQELLDNSSAWEKVLSREATTDKDGKFRLDGLVPGLNYDLGVNDELPQDVIRRERLSVESGKDKDLGDLK
jgi:RNA polymerase sigma factor (sigma-70 family)